MKPALWNILFAYVSLIFYGLCDNMRGPLYPEIMSYFGLTNSQASWFFAMASLMLIAGAAWVPSIIRRWGYLRSFQIAVGLMLASQMIYSISPSFVVVLIGSFFLGIAFGALNVIQNILVLVGSPPEKLSRYMSGLHANYAGASLLAPSLVALGAFFSTDFRLSFWISSGIGIILLMATFRIPEFKVPERAEASQKTKMAVDSQSLLFAAILSSYVLAEILVGTRIAQFVRVERGASFQESGYWTALFFGGLFLGRFAFSFLHFRMSLLNQVVIALLLTTVFSFLGMFVTPWAFAIVGLTMAPCYPMIMSLLNDYFPDRIEAVTSVCIVGTGVFVVIMHVAVGFIADHFGLKWVLSLAPIFAFLAALMLLRARKHA